MPEDEGSIPGGRAPEIRRKYARQRKDPKRKAVTNVRTNMLAFSLSSSFTFYTSNFPFDYLRQLAFVSYHRENTLWIISNV